MKKIINILKYIITFNVLIFLFNITLHASCSFDSNLIKKNIEESYEVLKEEGMFYKVSKLFNIRSDNSADALMINEAYSIDYKKPYLSYMKTRKNYKRNLTFYELPETVGELNTIYFEDQYKNGEDIYYDTISELGNFLNGRINHFTNYGRYWHGYLIFLRPLLLIFNIKQIRYLLLFLYIILFIELIKLLYKKFDKNVSLIYSLTLICSGYFSASYLIGNSSVFLIMMISSIILLKYENKIKNVGLYIFINGCLTSFFDYLTVPLITLCLPISIYILKLMKEKKDWKYCIKVLIKNSIIWSIGYISVWIFKWVQYDLTINDSYNMLSIGFGQVFFRMKRVNEAVGIDVSYISIIIKIISKSLLYTIFSIIILFVINKFKPIIKKLNKNVIPFLLLSFYPIIWFIILANHTILHAHFVYRHSLIFMLGILLCFYELFFVKEVESEKIY